jgi:hypothetical protein
MIDYTPAKYDSLSKTHRSSVELEGYNVEITIDTDMPIQDFLPRLQLILNDWSNIWRTATAESFSPVAKSGFTDPQNRSQYDNAEKIPRGLFIIDNQISKYFVLHFDIPHILKGDEGVHHFVNWTRGIDGGDGEADVTYVLD